MSKNDVPLDGASNAGGDAVPAAGAAVAQRDTPPAGAGGTDAGGLPAAFSERKATDVSKVVPKPVAGVSCVERDDSFTERFYLLQHPRNPACLRLDSRDRFVWRQIDGKATLEEVGEKYCLKFGSLAYDRIGSLFDRLVAGGFIEAPLERTRTRLSASVPADGFGSWLRAARDRLAFRRIGPSIGNDLFEALYSLVGFIPVTAPVLLAALPVLGVAGFIFFLMSLPAAGVGEGYRMFQPAGYYSLALAALYGWNLVGSIVHELARALALEASLCRVIRAGAVLRFGLLGITVDLQDGQKLPRMLRLQIRLMGMAFELFLGGLCGFLASRSDPSVARDLLGLGAVVFGIRLFIHACPLLKLDLYEAAVEASNLPHLRQAAIRFLQPRYWLKLWTKRQWEREELIFLGFGLWCVAWLTGAAKIPSFLFRTQLLETVLELLQRAISSRALFSPDEAVAFVLLVLVIVPALLFLVLTLFYVLVSMGRIIPQMKVWKNPTVLVGACALLSFFLGTFGLWLPRIVRTISSALSMGFLLGPRGLTPAIRGLQSALWLTLTVGGAIMAASLLAITRRETERLVTSRLAGALNLGTVAVLLGLFGALVQSHSLDSWPYLTAAGAIVSVPALLFMLRSLASTFSTPLFLPWLAMTGAIGVFVAAGIEASLAARIPASVSAATLRKLPVESWLGQLMASGWLFLTMGCGWWFLVRTREPILPRYPYGEGKTDKELLLHGFGYLLDTLLLNLKAYGGPKFTDRLSESVRARAQQLGVPMADPASFLPDPAATDGMDFDAVAVRLRELTALVTEEGMRVAGTRGLANLLHSAYLHLPWDERELVNTQLFQGTRWAATLGPSRAMPKSDRLELLRTTFLFHQYGDEELSRIAGIVRSRVYKPLETLIQQDDVGEEAYVIQRGRVQVQVEDAIGDAHIVAELGPGDFFGEMALLEDAPRSATVQALEEVDVLIIDRAVFARFVEHHGGAREKLAEAMRALRVIQKMPLFEEFSAGEMATVASKFHLERFRPGENIVTQGEMGDRFYIIQSGSAEVLVRNGEEDEKVRTLRPGEFFGEIALLQDIPRTATVRALEPMVAFALTKGDFLELVSGNPFAVRKLERESGRRVEDIQRRTQQKEAVSA
ncbi:MAG: cyclic nucleotide-binding domain-containing protein [Planctomycetes bacterium]|nr:cyclic nucleotide-binding domain-containing protein [Planctomycetota bacterium]